MSDEKKGKGKGVVQVVLEKKKKNGDPYYEIIIDGKAYYDSKGNFKDKKDQEIEYEFSTSDDGNICFINPAGGGFKSGGGGSRGKSPEELAMQKKAFALSYAKDQTNVLVQSFAHLIKELPDTMKYLDFMAHMREVASKMTVLTADDFLKKLSE